MPRYVIPLNVTVCHLLDDVLRLGELHYVKALHDMAQYDSEIGGKSRVRQ